MRTTINDVARYAGVGTGTVSRVLNGSKSVNENTKATVLNAIKELNYTPNITGIRLRTQHSKVIALTVPILYHPFFARFAESVEHTAQKYGYSILLVASQEHAEREESIIEKIKKREVDGAIFVTHYDHPAEIFEGCPLISIDRHLADGVPYVTSDNYESTAKSVEYLIECGCKRIGYLGTKPQVKSEVMLREQAYRDVMKAHGMRERILNEVTTHGNEDKLAERFLDEFPDVDGIFASGYSIARQLCGRAQARGIDIPDDLQVISYDGAFSGWSSGSTITCVEQPIEEMAELAVKLLIDRINGKKVPLRTVRQSKFVVGATTK